MEERLYEARRCPVKTSFCKNRHPGIAEVRTVAHAQTNEEGSVDNAAVCPRAVVDQRTDGRLNCAS